MTNFGATDPRSVELMREALRELYGLEGSLFEQYLNFWGRVVRGDFGPSLSAFPTPVMSLITAALPWTVGLLTLAHALHLDARQPARRARRLLPLEPRAEGSPASS